MKTPPSTSMLQDPRRLLVGGLRAKQILLATPLLKWYLDHGLEVTKVYQVVEYTPCRVFKGFADMVTKARREGDEHPNKAIIADTMKLLGNSAYGSQILDKEKHMDVKYVVGERKARMKVNEPQFRKLSELEKDTYEIESAKKRINLDLPIHLGYFILQHAKLRMLQFYYDCLCVYLNREDFEFIETDTDSAYFAVSAESLESLVVGTNREKKFLDPISENCTDIEVEADMDHWFPRTCCPKHKNYDKRTPGLFKLEASGHEMFALASKTYLLLSQIEDKLTCKGVNKKHVVGGKGIFHHVLSTERSVTCENVGFRALKGTIMTYEQTKKGFSYFYCKREVLDDGIRTKPLKLTLCPIKDYNISTFWGDFHPLSNAFPCELEQNGELFLSAEHLFSYEKACFHNSTLARCIAESVSIPEVRQLTKAINTDPSWHRCQDDIMKAVLELKLASHHSVRHALEKTREKTIVYTAKYDRFWGCGMNSRVAKLTNPKSFPGRNKLGVVWMEVRGDLVVE